MYNTIYKKSFNIFYLQNDLYPNHNLPQVRQFLILKKAEAKASDFITFPIILFLFLQQSHPFL